MQKKDLNWKVLSSQKLVGTSAQALSLWKQSIQQSSWTYRDHDDDDNFKLTD